MDKNLSYKILKYLILAIIIFVIFKCIPNQQLNDKECVLYSIIVVLIYALIENLYTFFLNDTSNSTNNDNVSCSTVCASKNEQFTNTNYQDSSSYKYAQAIKESNYEYNPNIIINGGMGNNNTSEQEQYVKPEVITEHDKNGDNVVKYPDESVIKMADGSYIIKPYKNPQAVTIGSRSEDGVMDNWKKYEYTDYNNFMVSNDKVNQFEYGYSFLPPSQWYPVPPHPPVCVSEKKCEVCPVYSSSSTADLKDWNKSRRISPPDNINVKFVEEVLNSGR